MPRLRSTIRTSVRGKRVLVVEDGPTLTHGEMPYGAGVVAARQCGAAELVDPRPYAVGSIRATYEKYRAPDQPAARHGLQRHAAARTGRDHPPHALRPGADRDADRPGPRDQDRQAESARDATKSKSSPSSGLVANCWPSSRTSTSRWLAGGARMKWQRLSLDS